MLFGHCLPFDDLQFDTKKMSIVQGTMRYHVVLWWYPTQINRMQRIQEQDQAGRSSRHLGTPHSVVYHISNNPT
jgi:hypothetical protein